KTAFWNHHPDSFARSLNQFDASKHSMDRYSAVDMGRCIAASDHRTFRGGAFDAYDPMNHRGIKTAVIQHNVALSYGIACDGFDSDDVAVFDRRTHAAAAHS